jgi:2,5-diketo-D-gluconate reductase B
MQMVKAKGADIPIVGLGTWDLRGRDCAQLVTEAVRLGYRHFDTAEMYGNEEAVGEGLRAVGIPREEIFVTTKVWPANFAPKDLERSAKESLRRLKLDAVDLLLLHWPNPDIPLPDTLGALNKVKREGAARHIGVSNFNATLLDQANRLSLEPLVCNQIELHPLLDAPNIVAATRRHGMAIVAYSPIARGRATHNALLERIGRAHGKTAAQVSLRYLVQRGIVVIPRTSKPARLKENIDIFDFELTAAEMRDIATLSSRGTRIVNLDWAPDWNA